MSQTPFTRFLGLLFSALLVLSGCATQSQRHNANNSSVKANANQATAASAQTKSSTEPASELDADLPRLDLDTEILNQLLVANFAAYARDWRLAAESNLKAAQSSDDPRLARLAVLWALQGKDYSLANQGAILWVRLRPEDREAKSSLLLTQLGLGDAKLAYESLRSQQADSTVEMHIKDTAALLVRQDNAQVAIDVAEMYLVGFPENSQVALSAAYVAKHFNHSEVARLWLERSLELDPSSDSAAQLMVSLLREQGDEEQHLDFIQKFLADYPRSVGMRLNYAGELAKQEKIDEALNLTKEVLIDEPMNVPALKYAAALAEYQEQVDLAKGYYKRVLRIEPDNDEVLWAMGRLAAMDKKYARAERYYQAIASEQFYFRAQLQVANMRYYTRGLRYAINTLRMLDPRTPQEYVDRATTRHYLLMQDYQYEEALAAINETLAFLPENLDLRYARALAAAELNEIQIAEGDLRFVLSQRPNHADAMNALGYTLADRTQRFDEAKELIEAALEIKPDQPHILDSMGWVLYRLGEFEAALKYLREAFKGAPQAEVAAHLGEVLWEMGQRAEAEDIWQKALAKESDNQLLNATISRYNEISALPIGATDKEGVEQESENEAAEDDALRAEGSSRLDVDR